MDILNKKQILMRRLSVGLMLLGSICSISSCQNFEEEYVSALPGKVPMTRSFSEATAFDVATFNIRGKIRTETEKVFTRVPAAYYSDGDYVSIRLRDRNLAENTAGLYVGFQTNSATLNISFTTLKHAGYYSGSVDLELESGVELYEVVDTKVSFLKVVTPSRGKRDGLMTYEAPDREMRNYLLMFPSYNGVTAMKINTEEGSRLREVELFKESSRAPILYYGTSITQGACASRYGYSYTASTLFELGHEVVNLGFDGAGMINDQMVDLLVQEPSSAFVIDAIWNVGNVRDPDLVEKRLKGLITRYRSNYPDTPILLMSKFNRKEFPPGVWEEILFKKVYLELRDAGITKLYFQPRGDVSYQQWGGGTHPNDKGMRTLADIINGRLKGMLSGDVSVSTNLLKYSSDDFYTTGSDNSIYIKGYSGEGSINLANVFPASFVGAYSKVDMILGMPKYVNVSLLSDSDSEAKIRYADRDHLGYSAQVRVIDDEKCQEVVFNVVAPPAILPTVQVAGRDWMIFNNSALTRETAMYDNMKVAELAPNTEAIISILKEKNISKYEKLIGHFYNYNRTTAATRLKGKPASSPTGNPCPPGFELPSLNDYRALMGMPALDILNITEKVGHVKLVVNQSWTSPQGSNITLKDDGPFRNGELIDLVPSGVRYTTVIKDGVTLYFINNGAFDAPYANLLHSDKCTSLLTKDLTYYCSKRICFGRNGWNVEANAINNVNSGHTGVRCVKMKHYETRPLD